MTEIYMRHHDLTSDEPETSGGNGTGPDPYDLLRASLGSCTDMTMRWYTDHRCIDFGRWELTLEYNRIYIEDCKFCAEGDPLSHIDHIKRTVEISENPTDEQKERMLNIPAKCPVARTLKSSVVIEDDVKYV